MPTGLALRHTCSFRMLLATLKILLPLPPFFHWVSTALLLPLNDWVDYRAGISLISKGWSFILYSSWSVIHKQGIDLINKARTTKIISNVIILLKTKFNLPKVFCLKLMAFYACNNGLLSIYFLTIYLIGKENKHKSEFRPQNVQL